MSREDRTSPASRLAASSSTLALFDPRNGDEPFRLKRLCMPAESFEPERTNYFSLYWIAAGEGAFSADAGQYAFHGGQLLCFVPYQRLRFLPQASVDATLIQFHANFLCVETFHAEAGCSGTLFNDPYNPPVVSFSNSAQDDFAAIVLRLQREVEERRLGYRDAFLAGMKLLLILAAREKNAATTKDFARNHDFRDPLIEKLRELIELHYCELHAPAEYAALLHLAPKALGRRVRERLGMTLTDLIRDRILVHAKWQLLHTLRSVKEIAAELGFHDELYFSRLFKKATGLAPSVFREFETEIRGGSNLSISLAAAPMPSTMMKADN